MFPSLSLLFTVAIALAGAMEDVAMIDSPPLSPAVTERVVQISDVNPSCVKAVNSFLTKANWHETRILSTVDDKYGVIYRVDFLIAGGSAVRLNRIVCWMANSEAQTKVSLAQPVDPLPV